MRLLFFIYVALGYWAAGVVFYENKVVIHTFGALLFKKLCIAMFLGFIVIPIAILKKLASQQ